MTYVSRFASVNMKKRLFGVLPTGEDIYIYPLSCGESEAEIITFGAALRSYKPFGDVDIVGGFDTLEDYLVDDSHQGATIGRVANRIAGAQFTMDGAVYMVTENDHGNCLHGGVGFDRQSWTVDSYDGGSITLSYRSEDGEEGFPSALTAKVTYTLTENALIISYEAIPEGKTPIALTNHSYFNLDGFGDTIKEHTARFFADRYTETDGNCLPTDNRPQTRGTVFDFRDWHKIGERIGGDFIGYDHNMILAPTVYKEFLGLRLGLGASVEGKSLRLNVYTDQPGVQFYIANFLGSGPDFKGGVPQVRHGAFCLETQTEPNCINHGEGFYDAGEVYRHICVYEIQKK